MNYKIFPLSENAVTIDFGNEISVEINEKVISLYEKIKRNSFVGLVDVVPAYSSLTVFFNVLTVRNNYLSEISALSFVSSFLQKTVAKLEDIEKRNDDIVLIPVNYSRECAPDLEDVARIADLSIEEVVKIHTGYIYRVFMIGFLPGFAYMGEVDERIAIPRRKTPRLKVEKGSVGIAGRQTGIYSLESPGGWQIIGKTGVNLFQPDENPITLLKSGDSVRFYDLNKIS